LHVGHCDKLELGHFQTSQLDAVFTTCSAPQMRRIPRDSASCTPRGGLGEGKTPKFRLFSGISFSESWGPGGLQKIPCIAPCTLQTPEFLLLNRFRRWGGAGVLPSCVANFRTFFSFRDPNCAPPADFILKSNRDLFALFDRALALMC
jgi:hypothetical protein